MLYHAIVFGLVSSLSIASAALLHFPNSLNRIVGGKPINIEEIPYQVSLNFYGQHICGGSILSERFVLSAAHCTDDAVNGPASAFTVRTGSNYSESFGTLHKVITFYRHSHYNPNTYEYDFCIFVLLDPIVYDETRRPIQLPSPGEDIEDGAVLKTSGWGATLSLDESNFHLRAVDVRKVNHFECVLKYIFQNMITDSMFCAGVRGGGKDACQGDSGGPIVKNGTLLVGVVSWGTGCALPQYPGVYGRISTVRDWIKSITGV